MKKLNIFFVMVFIFAACLNLEAKLPEKEGIFEFGNNKGYIYLPDNFQKGGNYKFILFFHGAGYKDGQPGNVGHEGFEKFRKMAAEKGYIIAVPSYGTTWYSRKAENITDAMLNHLEKELGIKLDRIHVMGGSMGGLSALVWSARNIERVMSICTFYAVADVLAQYHAKEHHAKAMVSNYGGTYEEKPYWYESRRANNYASTLATVPVLLLHGEEDVLVSPQQSENLYYAIKNAGGNQVEYIAVPKFGHNNNMVKGYEERIFEFLDKAEKINR